MIGHVKSALIVILLCGITMISVANRKRIMDLESQMLSGVEIANETIGVLDNVYEITKHGSCVMFGLPVLIEQTKLSTVHIRVNNMWQGSGVIIGEHTVLTAGHVVDGAENIEIMLSNGHFLRSKSFHKDPNNDCGIIKFKEVFLPSRVAPLGDSNSITVGMPVLVIGSPYGDTLFNTVAFGIVSGLNREIGWLWPDVVTLDCLADPGYSGGPVFNMNGEIMGIVVGTYSRYGNATVITPIDICKEGLKNEKTNKPSGDNNPVGEHI